MKSLDDFYQIIFPIAEAQYGDIEGQVRRNLIMFATLENKFESNLRLFDYASGMSDKTHDELQFLIEKWNSTAEFHRERHECMTTMFMYINWERTAAEAGIYNLFSISELIEAVNTDINRVPNYCVEERVKRKRSANALWKKCFPSLEGLRYTVAHLAEMLQPKGAKHQVDKPFAAHGMLQDKAGKSGHFVGQLSGRTYTSNYRGKLVSLEMSEATLQRLREVKLAFYSIFAPLSDTS